MKLKKISIYNLRSIKKLEDIDVSNGFDVIIGQNDSGKSTLLYALRNFFDVKDGNFNFENLESKENDLCHNSVNHNYRDGKEIVSDTEIGVVCEFFIEDEDILPERSELVSHIENNSLSILKRVSKDKKYNKKQFQYFVLGKMFIDDERFNKLGNLDEQGLIELMKKYPKSEEYLENINKAGKPENVERRKALQKFAEENVEFVNNFIEFDFKKEVDALWPIFEIVDSSSDIDGKNKIIDSIFTSISKKIIDSYKNESAEYKALLNKIENEFSDVSDRICKHAKSRYIRNLESIKAAPIVSINATRDLLIKRVGQTEYSHWNCQGDGTKRRLMVSILQCGKLLKTLTEKTDKKKNVEYEKLKIWAFDEPELHLHPGAQRDLFLSLNSFKDEGYQIICSTHSTIFVDNLNISSTHLLDLDDDLFTREIKQENKFEDLIKESLGIRNSDIFFSNAFVIVEGETEMGALPILHQHLYDKPIDFYGIKIVCCNGCDKSFEKMKLLIDNFDKCIGLLDVDAKDKMVEFKNWEENGTLKYIGEKCDFEDAFPNEIWIKLLNDNFSVDGWTWDEETLLEIRKRISKDECNNKILKLIENQYRSKYMEIHNNETSFDKNFNKIEIGKMLANISIEMNMIPQVISDLFKDVHSKILLEEVSI